MSTSTIMIPRHLLGVSNRRTNATTAVSNETRTSDRYQAGNLPKSALGSPVSAVIGRKRVANANTVWTGNLRPLTEITYDTITQVETIGGATVTTTTETTTTTITGYLVDVHMAICLGPDVSLKTIYVDNGIVWSGDVGPARTAFAIDANNTFLSEADCVFSGGAFDQAPEVLITEADYPGYVGIATILLRGVRADLPMGSLSFEVVRVPNPLTLSAGDNRSGDDVNTLSAVVEVMTNEWGYGGVTAADVDIAGLAALAATVASEGNYCSIKLDSATNISAVLSDLAAQIDAAFYQNPQTGKIVGKLIRASSIDYVSSELRFSSRNIIDMRSFDKSGWQDTINKMQAFYTERDADYNEVPVSIQNAANISQSGRGQITATIRYPYSPTGELTAKLAARDLAKVASPFYSFSMETNRDGAERTPGDIIVVDWPDYDLINVPVLVERVRKQPIDFNTVVLDVSRIKFPDTKSYAPTAISYNPGFSVSPVKPVFAEFIEAPKFIAARGGSPLVGTNGVIITSLDAGFGYRVVALPTPVNPIQSKFTTYHVLAENYEIGIGYYPTIGTLVGGISRFDGFATGTLTSITIDGVTNPINLENIGIDGVRGGRLLMFIGDEIMSFESFIDNGDGSYTLNGVHRALLDTTLIDHADNSRVAIINSGSGYNQSTDQALYSGDSPTPDFGISSATLSENGTDIAVFPAAVTPINRMARPLRPHNTKVNGEARSATPIEVAIEDSVTVTWSTRSRYNVVALMLDAAEAPQTSGANSQTHRVYHQVTGGGTITDIGAIDYTGNTATFDMPTVTLGAGSIFVASAIEYSGDVSPTTQLVYIDHIPVDIVPPPLVGYGNEYGFNYGTFTPA